MISKNNTRFLITLNKRLYEQLKNKADKENRTMSNYVSNLIKEDLRDKAMFQVVGLFWNNRDFDIIGNNEKFCVLNTNEWNGEKYYKCWEVKDIKGLYPVDNKKYTIEPVYEEIEEDEFEIIDYKIEED